MTGLARGFYLAVAVANLAACATTHTSPESAPSMGPPAPIQTDTPDEHWWTEAWRDFRHEPIVAKAIYGVSAATAVWLANDVLLHGHGNTNPQQDQHTGDVCPPGTIFTPVGNATNSAPGSNPVYSCVYQNQNATGKRTARTFGFHFGKSW